MLSIPVLTLTGGALFAGLRIYRRRESLASKLTQETANAGEQEGSPDGPTSRPVERSLPRLLHPVLGDDENRKLTITGLAGATAAIHLVVGLQAATPILVLNGVGFAALLAARYAIPQLASHGQVVDDLLIA